MAERNSEGSMKTLLIATAGMLIAGAAQAMCGGGTTAVAGAMCGIPAQAQSGQSMPGGSMPGMSMPGMGGTTQGQPQQGGMMQGCPMMKQMASMQERILNLEDMMRPSRTEPPKQ